MNKIKEFYQKLDPNNQAIFVVASIFTVIALFLTVFVIFNSKGEKDVTKEFTLSFDLEEAIIEEGKSEKIDIVYRGDLSKALATEAIIKYNPDKVKISSIEKGTLFDIYIGDAIDEEKGIVTLSGAFIVPEDSSEDPIFASLTVERLEEGNTNLTLASEDNNLGVNTRYINVDSEVVEMNGNSIVIK